MASIGSLPSLVNLFTPLTMSTSGATTTTISTLPTIGSATLLDYFSARATAAETAATSASASSAANSAASAAQTPPWDTPQLANSPTRDAQVLSTTNFINLDTATLTTGASSSANLQKDNQKLFALYQGVNQLYYLASMSRRSTTTPGQQVGYNTRFQAGLSQIQSFVGTTSFNDFTLQAGQTSSSVTSSVGVPLPAFSYGGATIVGDANVGNPLPGVSTSDSFNIAVTKSGTTTNVPIALSQVQGPLTIDNIDSYINQQLAAAGFSTRFARVMTSGSINDPTKATYGISITQAPSESVTLSSASAAPALYVAGTTGSPTSTTTVSTVNGAATTSTAPPDQLGRLVKLTGLSGSPAGAFSDTVIPSSGTTTVQSSVVDANGSIYVVGNATGNFGNQLNQGSQDVYLSKYDSAGSLQWTQLLGSAGTASGYSVALDPKGGVVVAGSTTADLTTGAVADGNSDSFVASYDANGSQSWQTQVPTLSSNKAQAVNVDSSGNVYIGGQVTGVLGAGQTSSGSSDAYVTKLDTHGKIVYEQQFGTSGNDHVAATAMTSDGGLVVASVQNGDAIVSKYANGDATQAPAWQVDLGSLQNGSLGNLAVSGNQIYLSGTTSNATLTAGGQATVANANSGGQNAFVFNLTDQGSSATPDTVSYVGADGTTSGNAVTVGSDGTVYLAGSTTGTFAGQMRNVANVNNMFVAALAPNGNIDWTRQYGGIEGQSSAQSVSIDPQGSSVLDALGLPRGSISVNQSVSLASATTLRPGDSFGIDIQGTGARNATITIGSGETLTSLVDKINAELLNAGKASVSYGLHGEQLKITVNPGVTANLVAGPADFNALGRLGIPAGALTAPAKSTTNSASAHNSPSSSGSSSKAQTVYGLGLTGSMDISTSTSAGAAHAELGNILAQIRNIYQKINAPPSSSSSTTQQSSGPAPAYLTAQVSSYNLALSLLSSNSTSGTLA